MHGVAARAAAMLVLAAATLAAGAAGAADLVLKAPPPPPAPAADPWTGGYLGVNGGYGAGGGSTDTLTSTFIPSGGFASSSNMTIAPSGWFGGVQGGYNWQKGHLVIGAEADIQGSPRQSALYCGFLACPSITSLTNSGFGTTVTQSLDWFGTARARLGWDAGPALIYATGGLAFGQVTTNIAGSFNGTPPTMAAAGFRDTRLGWAVGGGVEAPVWGKWTLKAEYLHVELAGLADQFTVPAALLPALGGGIAQNFALNSNVRYDTVRVGLNYQFGDVLALGRRDDTIAAALPSLFTKAPLARVAPYNWSGVYAGANLGYAAGSQSLAALSSTIIFTPPIPLGERMSLPPTGIIGGAQLGANKQFGQWVLGVEGDFQGSGASATYCGFLQCAPGAPTITLTAASWLSNVNQRLDWFATLRARVGVTTGNVLYYVTGGPAWGKTNSTITETFNSTPPTAAAASFNDTRFGYAVGGGVEAALWGNWTAKFEYLYLNLGSATDSFLVPATVSSTGFAQTFTLASTVHDHIFRVGANYKFAPLPAFATAQ